LSKGAIYNQISANTFPVETYLDGGKRWADYRDVAAHLDRCREFARSGQPRRSDQVAGVNAIASRSPSPATKRRSMWCSLLESEIGRDHITQQQRSAEHRSRVRRAALVDVALDLPCPSLGPRLGRERLAVRLMPRRRSSMDRTSAS
jgi:hypothetical protein